MRIVMVRSNPVSPDSRVEKEADALNKAGHEIRVLAWDRSKSYKSRKDELTLSTGVIDIYRIGVRANYGGGFKSFLPLIAIQIKFFKWLVHYRDEYDVIHACDFDTAVIGFLCARILRKKFVYDIFDYYVASHDLPKFLARAVERIDTAIINAADSVIICSDERKQQLKLVKPRKLEVIHNSPADIHKQSLRGEYLRLEPSTRIRIAYVGILSGSRLIRELVDCVASRDDCELHIGGFGQLEDYIVSASKRFSNVYWYGRIPYSETLQLEEQCDILTALYDPAIPNHRYAAPNKFYEALFLGKPLIVAENTGIDTIVRMENIGVVVPYSREGLDCGITELIDRRDEWGGIKERSSKLYEERYSWGIMEKRLQYMYQSLEDSQ